MEPLVKQIISSCWGVFIIVWLLAAIFTNRTIYRQPGPQRLAYILPIVIGGWLLFRSSRLPGPLNLRIIPHADALLVAAAILCLGGLGFCFWARALLGRNWSGTVTLKENHELIVRGPYRLVRHPIYTGLLAMALATAIQHGNIGGLLGFLLIAVSFWIKSTLEEAVMLKQFPDQYAGYRERVKRIVPFIL
ncbi:MAG TPA: isoprenylcysteine carboxylmethyltransferase family protein [Chthoniobacterales bacterium]|jgi:protein-S-isoprenylcysteine O-methyltransferase Ste14|nr:isoprenylcysteine carboxylmethyltransferase family protein [Chthoniobacterales bacterium]